MAICSFKCVFADGIISLEGLNLPRHGSFLTFFLLTRRPHPYPFQNFAITLRKYD